MKISETLVKKCNLLIQKRMEISRFVIVGVIATITHYGIYYLLTLLLDVQINVAYSIGYLLSFILNFYLSVYYTFKTKASIKKGLGFGMSHFINYLLHMLFLNIYLYIGFSETVAPLPVYATVVPINFYLVRKVLKSKQL